MAFYVILLVQGEKLGGCWRKSARENTRNDPLAVTFKKVTLGGRYVGFADFDSHVGILSRERVSRTALWEWKIFVSRVPLCVGRIKFASDKNRTIPFDSGRYSAIRTLAAYLHHIRAD